MSVTVRLSKTGKKNRPTYRIVASQTRSKRGGQNLEILGHYDPLSNPPVLEINKEGIKKWESQGALISKAVEKLLKGKYTFEKYEPKKAEAKG